MAERTKNEPFGVITPPIWCVEGLIEALVALDDDEKLMRRTEYALYGIRARRRYERECFRRGVIDTAELERCEAQCDSAEEKLQSLNRARADRLRDVIKPEVKRCATRADEAA